MPENDLRDIIKIIRKRLWIMILTAVILPLITGLVSYYYMEPLYQTYATLLIGRPEGYEGRLEYSDVLLNQQLAPTYSEIAKSRHVSSELISRLKLEITNDEVRQKIEVSSVVDTEIIKISVIDSNPDMASRMANELSNIFIGYVSQVMKIDNIQFVDKAEVPVKPFRPNIMLNIAVAAIAGLLIGLFFVLLVEYFDNTIKTQEDIEKYFMLPVLGVIPKV